jgi:hypothetical protein
VIKISFEIQNSFETDFRIFIADANKVYIFRRFTHGSTCHGDRTYMFTCCNSSNQLNLRHFRSCWQCDQAQRHYNENTNSKWDEVKAKIVDEAAYHTIRKDVSHQWPSKLSQCSDCLTRLIIVVDLCDMCV